MHQKVSATIGIVGGVIDLVVGFVSLQQSMSGSSMGMMPSGVSWVSYFLLALGIVVLLSGLYMFAAQMVKNRATFGWLMIIYGIIMLLLGFAMINGMVAMMQGSILSGTVMIFVGVAMLFSGYSMRKM